jgi:hypothetical protein
MPFLIVYCAQPLFFALQSACAVLLSGQCRRYTFIAKDGRRRGSVAEGFDGGGFNINDSAQTNVNRCYTYRRTGGARSGGGGGSGCGCLIFLLASAAWFWLIGKTSG